MEQWLSTDPDAKFYTCVSLDSYKYGNICGLRDPNKCGSTQQPCLWSYPADDPDKWNSAHAACRNLPDEYNNVVNPEGWKYGTKINPKEN